MFGNYRKLWSGLQLLAVGLMFLGAFGPLNDPWDRIASGVGAALMVVWICAVSWKERRERQADQSSSSASVVRRAVDSWLLLPALALGLLSLGTLTPISDLWDKVFSWTAVAIFLVYVGVPMWELHRAIEEDRSKSAGIPSGDQT